MLSRAFLFGTGAATHSRHVVTPFATKCLHAARPRATFRALFGRSAAPKTEADLPQSLREGGEFRAPTESEMPNPVHELVQAGKERVIGSWLLLTAGSVFFMVVLGGYTRLTNSGLSMTRWKPVQATLPASDAAWEEEFAHYKQFPEYQLANAGMTLDAFKRIFFVEWLHRFVGSSLGVVFGVPLAYFWARGYLRARMRTRLAGLLLLGGTQGLIGWWMVKSGLREKPDYQSRPRVSVYRLTVHLCTAVTIYSLLLWNALTLLRAPQERLLKPQHLAGTRSLRAKAILLLHCVAINIFTGACAAGIDAMKVFNDWPLYNGAAAPPGLFEREPTWRNFFENRGLVQFNHRNAGYLTLASTLYTLFAARRLDVRGVQRLAVVLVGGTVSLQVTNGILTLLHNTPKHEANLHQLNALLVLTSIIFLLHTCRAPSPLYAAYLKRFL